MNQRVSDERLDFIAKRMTMGAYPTKKESRDIVADLQDANEEIKRLNAIVNSIPEIVKRVTTFQPSLRSAIQPILRGES
ncbi:hypothetical protein [Alicyclobacillus dauci]|uniref:Uncharacterized protein n=1 Tax=Alicyclobacillus dauci TaxID=1475485 RepID=A0ABY6Z6Z0_9BACL|nr:hypothetical protein [Alicyclobacillus dauci]WAH38597.1 hypothetical protein NZD86_08995 [Alicyclobacillus dauci]